MVTENKRTNYMDIDSLIDKVSKLPIPDTEKADLLRKFKENMMNPDRGEIENLNRIQSKYSTMYPGTANPQGGLPVAPVEFLPSINPNLSQMPTSSMAMMMPQQLQQNCMTTAHFDVLKNKMDSIQLELVDLLRHVKDYTQRYMNATRQQDMEKIDAYINGLFEVDKQMKRAEEQAAVMATEEEADVAAAEPEKSTITRATDGIKNFLGSIGDGVSGITSFVSSTANIVNDTLSKKVLSTPTTTTTSPNTVSPNTASATNTSATNNTSANTASLKSEGSTNIKGNSKGNIVSVDDYINSNMNQIESTSPVVPASSSTSNPNNITSSNNINAMARPEVKKEKKVETAESNQEEITAAINKLNDTMNADINNTVKNGQDVMTESQAGGGSTARQENHLTKKIRMLRLRLTKQKLEEQLLDKDRNRNSKTKTRVANRAANRMAHKYNVRTKTKSTLTK
jgi:hypothetical protein